MVNGCATYMYVMSQFLHFEGNEPLQVKKWGRGSSPPVPVVPDVLQVDQVDKELDNQTSMLVSSKVIAGLSIVWVWCSTVWVCILDVAGTRCIPTKSHACGVSVTPQRVVSSSHA